MKTQRRNVVAQQRFLFLCCGILLATLVGCAPHFARFEEQDTLLKPLENSSTVAWKRAQTPQDQDLIEQIEGKLRASGFHVMPAHTHDVSTVRYWLDVEFGALDEPTLDADKPRISDAQARLMSRQADTSVTTPLASAAMNRDFMIGGSALQGGTGYGPRSQTSLIYLTLRFLDRHNRGEKVWERRVTTRSFGRNTAQARTPLVDTLFQVFPTTTAAKAQPDSESSPRSFSAGGTD